MVDREIIDFGFGFAVSAGEPETFMEPAAPAPPLTVEDFRYDLYDWNDLEFLKANRGPGSYRAVRLTRGYFMLVSAGIYPRVTKYADGSEMKWHVKIDRDPDGNIINVYARRRGRSGEPHTVYAHRMITGCLHASKVDVDHMNGIGLDNRALKDVAINLAVTTTRTNIHNAVRVNVSGLPPGVERVGEKKRFFGGKICKRHGQRVRTIRSKKHWKEPGPAHQWYLNQLKRMNGGREAWASNPTTVDYPTLPPRWEVEPASRPKRITVLRRKSSRRVACPESFDNDVPF